MLWLSWIAGGGEWPPPSTGATASAFASVENNAARTTQAGCTNALAGVGLAGVLALAYEPAPTSEEQANELAVIAQVPYRAQSDCHVDATQEGPTTELRFPTVTRLAERPRHGYVQGQCEAGWHRHRLPGCDAAKLERAFYRAAVRTMLRRRLPWMRRQPHSFRSRGQNDEVAAGEKEAGDVLAAALEPRECDVHPTLRAVGTA
jgi:hypothetical protein